MVARLLKLFAAIIVLSIISVIGFAYLGDLSPQQAEHSEQVTFELD